MTSLKKIALYALGPIGVSGISFLVIPILAWKYSPDIVADYAILQAIIAFGILFFTLGSDQAFFRNYYESQNKAQLLKNVLIISTLPMVFILTVIVFGGAGLGDYIYTKTDIWIVFLTLVCVFFAVINRIFSLIQRLENQAFLFSLSQFLPKIIFFIAILIPIVTNDPNFYWIVGGQALGFLIVNLYFFYINKKILINSYFASIDKILIKKILDYGLPLLVSNILFWLLRYADRFYVKYLSNSNELAIYALAASIAGGFAIIGTLFNTIWMPKALKLYEKNNLKVKYLEKVAFLVSFFGFCMVILTFVFKGVIGEIFPPIYYDIVYLLPLLILPSLYYTVAEIMGIGISLSKKTSKMVIVTLVCVVFHFFLSMTLVPKFGALGASLSIGISFYIYMYLKMYFSKIVWLYVGNKYIHFLTFISLVISILLGFEFYA